MQQLQRLLRVRLRPELHYVLLHVRGLWQLFELHELRRVLKLQLRVQLIRGTDVA